MNGFRWPAAVLIPALLIGGIVLDREQRPEPAVVADAATARTATMAPADAGASLWYCAAAAIEVQDRLTIINTTEEIRVGEVTLVEASIDRSEIGQPTVVQSVEVPAQGRIDVVPGELMPGDEAVSAVVELNGGGVLVERTASVADLGATDRRPCVSQASGSWYFPVGATVEDAREELILFNPFPDDVVVDIRFDTDLGPREPEAYEAIVVAGRSAQRLVVDDEVAVVERASGRVEARSGRLVVDRVLVYDATDDRRGLSVSSGGSGPSTEQYLPGGVLGEGRQVSIIITNPSATAAEVDIEILTPDDFVVEPLERRVPARESVEVVLTATSVDGVEGRVLDGVTDFAAVVRSVNDVPVVAERRDLVLPGANRVPGLQTTIASPVAAAAWVIDAPVTPGSPSRIAIFNPSFETIVTATVTGPGVDQTVELGPGSVRIVSLADITPGEGGAMPLMVTGSAPIVVERELVFVNSRSSSIGVIAE